MSPTFPEPPDDLRIRSLDADRIPTVLGWAAAEGWNPGRHDAATIAAVDPHGVFVAERDGEPVGAFATVLHADDYAFVGLYLVVPEQRGQGIGMALWQRGLARIDAMATDLGVVGLDGVVERQDDYRRSGFVLAHRNLRFEGPAGAWKVPPPVGTEILTASAVDVDHLVALDARHNPSPRPRYLDAWLNQPGARTATVLGPGGDPVGLAVARPAARGWRVGPLVAPSPTAAEALLGAVLADVPDDEVVVIDVPEVNAAAMALAADHGMEVSFETARMYRGGRPRHDTDGWYGVTSLELG